MKNIKYIFSFFLLAVALGCSEDDNLDFVNDADAPSNISALFTITQDNTGKVTIQPHGEGVTSYRVEFGDGSTEPAAVIPGETVENIYAEGNYSVTITGIGINGAETSVSLPLTVAFVAPQNLAVTITPAVGNPFQISLTAEADFATYFDVTFGEDPSQVPVQFNPGQSVEHTYAAVGSYEVTVTAYSGGSATSQETTTVTIFDPLLLPVTFESPTLNYAYGDFGGAYGSVADNPDVSSGNTSAKFGKLTNTAGAEVWGGTTLLLDEAIDFSTFQKISMKVWSPAAGITVKFKIENGDNSALNAEVDAVTTVANQWETLTYDFSGIDFSNSYHRIALFFDFGNSGTGVDYFFDDIQLTDGTPQLELPLTFESSVLDYEFGNFGGAFTAVVDNPQSNGINTSAKVGQFTKNAGSETWAGSFIELAQPMDFSSLQKIKMKVWSPAAGVTVLMKLENLANATINMEVPAVTTVAGGWQELTFDFTGIVNANQYQRLIIFCDFGVVGNGANYYFDDIQLTN